MTTRKWDECVECGKTLSGAELLHPYNANEINACIPCWREALAAGGWPGDTADELREEPEATES